MYISKRGDRLYLMESVWVKAPATGKMRSVSKVVKSLGRIDELTAEDPDALEKLRAFYKSQSKVNLATQETKQFLDNKEKEDTLGGDLPASMPLLCYANYIVKPIWNDTLGLKKPLDYQQKKDRIAFNASEMLFQAVVTRMLMPSSQLRSFKHQCRWLGNSLAKESLWDMYRMLDFVQKHRDLLMKTAHRSLTKEMGRDLSMVFYDVTNTWFETPYTDLEKQQMKMAKALSALPDDIPQSVINDVIREIEEENPVLRMRGPSKEHRLDPIVSIAMIVDRDGIPVDFRIYPGNASEKQTMKASIDALAQEYGIKNSIIVADRGLNSAHNLEELLREKHGFLVAQSLAGMAENDRKKALSEDNWKWINEGELKVKEIQYLKKTNSEALTPAIPCRLIVGWSKTRYDRDKCLIELNKIQAQQAVNEKRELKRAKYSWQGYVTADKQYVIGLNTRKIQKDELLAGYFAYVYKEPPSEKDSFSMSADQILGHYRSLEKIEESFRIMKSTFNLRPYFVRTQNHIEAVTTICILALIMLRVLTKKLKLNGHSFSTDEIIDALRNAYLTAWIRPNTPTVYIPTRSDSQEILNGQRSIDLTKLTTLDKIIEVLGLKRIAPGVDKNQLARCLKTRFDSEEAALGATYIFGKKNN